MFRICIILGFFILMGCNAYEDQSVVIDHQGISIKYDKQLRSQVINKILMTKGITNISQPEISEYLLSDQGRLDQFKYDGHLVLAGQNELGDYAEYIITGLGQASAKGLRKKIHVRKYKAFPALLAMRVTYINDKDVPFTLSAWVSHAVKLSVDTEERPAFWSFNGASYEDRRDWVLPIIPGFSQENYLGMNATDYGGGIPVSVVWNRNGGISVGHLERSPQLLRLPIEADSTGNTVTFSVRKDVQTKLAPGDSLHTLETFIAAHEGDFFSALQQYSQIMRAKGLKFAAIPSSAYDPVWCAWGYERNFTVDQVLQTLSKVKELGFNWAVLDDGWQTAEGDWYLSPEKFPAGDPDMQALVKKIRQSGLRSKLWWAPLAVDPGTDLLRDHADMLLINENGKPQDISWWDSYYLCPAYEKTREYTRNLVVKIMRNWGFEGLKIDGQHLNGVPPCYNPAHKHAYPEESVEQLPQFFEDIYQTAIRIVPDAVIEICPCGTAASFFNMPFMNQPVSSDPLSSWQIRLKGKTFKSLMGSHTAYYGDHVELSDGGNDFASSVGIGAVVGTKFTWPKDNHDHTNYLLTAEKEAIWRKWTGLYQRYRLSEGEYLGGLYDLGFDRPEAHVIHRDDFYYYAFYADEFDGKIELRGFPDGVYRITDYEHERQIGEVNSNKPELTVKFKHHLLLKAEKTE